MSIAVFLIPRELLAQPSEAGAHGRGGTTEWMSFRACEEANERRS